MSPVGTWRLLSSCGGPQTPIGNAPYPRAEATNGKFNAAPSRTQVSSRFGATDADPIGATPSARVGAKWAVATPSGLNSVKSVAGTIVVSTSENSGVTTYGRSLVPSGVGAFPPEGCAPDDTITVSARATPGEASARYLAMNGPASSSSLRVWSELPNSTVIEIGPTSNVAVPWKSGPSTSIDAPRLIEIVISPKIQVSIVTPAEIRA